MPKYAAFLRGVNLGRNRRVSSAELRTMYEGMGFDQVASFRTSGNVVFASRSTPLPRLKERVEKGMAEALGWDVQVFLRTADEVRAIAAHQPFDSGLSEGADGKLQVFLLPAKPKAATRTEVLALANGSDRLAFGEQELYWLPSGRTVESELDLRAIEKLVGPTTRRTKGTIELLAAKFFAS
jgi:uncharacterized protein (DUF1697 family)